MGSNIYTRGGDGGQTSLADGSRVAKDSVRVEAYGSVDEASSMIGLARSFGSDPVLDKPLEFLQHRLFNCSTLLALPSGSTKNVHGIASEDIDYLESMIDRFTKKTGALSGFVLPGGSKMAGYLHVARTVTRRAERRIVNLAQTEAVDPLVLKFINRSSDFLFAAARMANVLEGQGDVLWVADLPRSEPED